MSDNFHTHPKPGTFTGYGKDTDEKGLRLTIERLTAELEEWEGDPEKWQQRFMAPEVERLTALGDAMCTAARNTDYAMLHEACAKWEAR